MSTTTTVTSAWTQVYEAKLGGKGQPECKVVNFECSNTGAALTDFKIEVQLTPDGTYQSVAYLSGTNFASVLPEAIHWLSVDPRTLASGSDFGIIFDVWGAYAVKFSAKCASSTVVVANATAGEL